MHSSHTVCNVRVSYTLYIHCLYIVHTDSQLYFDKYKMCVQNYTKNQKVWLCGVGET